jgi:hypothetical protein
MDQTLTMQGGRTMQGRRLAVLVLGGLVSFLAGCGELSVRSWINIDPNESSGTIQFGPTFNQPVNRIQGGFHALVRLDTTDLPGPLAGTVVVEDVRAAGTTATFGTVCIWSDPFGRSEGIVEYELETETARGTVAIDTKATTALSELFGLLPGDLETEISLEVPGVGLPELFAAETSGSVDGILELQIPIVEDISFGGLAGSVALDLALATDSQPPVLDADLLNFCDRFFARQGEAPFYGVNTKSSYLRARRIDDPVAALAISLAELDALPGDTLLVTQIGSFASNLRLKDGRTTAMTGLFSGSNLVASAGQRHRVPDAIDAGTDFVSDSFLECTFGIFCRVRRTDIDEDFAIDPEVEVTIPGGASYLIVAPYDRADMLWGDNSGFSLGVDIEVIRAL